MFRHVVMFRFRDDASPAARAAVFDGLAALPAQIDEIRSYVFGTDAGLRPDNFDAALVADFASPESFATYVAHPAHQAFVVDVLTPAVATRHAVQFLT